jgi:uncharacterized protein (TIGR03435 family)
MRLITTVSVGIFVLCATTFAQGPASKPSFEVASVRPGAPFSAAGQERSIGIRGGPGTEDPGQITCRWVAVLNLLVRAYGVKNFQIQGLPDWANNINSDRYDILAKVPPGTTLEQANLMLQNLLVERFGLVVHHETKQGEIYELTVAKGESKLKAPADPSAEPSLRVVGGRVLTATNEPLSALIPTLEAWRHLVVDKTGLTAKYDFSMPFVFPPGNPVDSSSDPDPSSALNSILQSDLGLKLEKKKGPIDILVIDHLEKNPTPN